MKRGTTRGPETPAELRAWRVARGLSQREAAELVGYSVETWRSYELGRLAISPRVERVISLIERADEASQGEVAGA